MNAVQKQFIGGINQLAAEFAVGNDEYVWAVNARTRFGVVEPANKHVLQADVPAGKKQGGIGVGNVAIIFIDGKAYYREQGTVGWTVVPGFSMSADADRLWACAVPASTLNFQRKAAANVNADIVLTTDLKIAGTPTGILVQDEVNQPQLIEFDFVNQIYTARTTKNYNEWMNNGSAREYVPVGKQMIIINQTLFIVARDGKSVYRSITGRPLDFMVVVDQNGNKLATESAGGAAQVSFAMDFDIITCLQPINVPDSFVYGTARNTRIVSLDYINTIFGEPRFRTAAIISAGIVNQFSFVELIGDYAFIDAQSVKSFDAVQLLRFQGANSIFSRQISKITFNKASNLPLKQQNCSCIVFDNYALFNIDSLMGNLIAVYDMIVEKWVSFDITKVFKVKQFFITEDTRSTKLYAITVKDEVYEMYALSTERENAIIKTRAFAPDATSTEHKPDIFRPKFTNATYAGEATVLPLIDEHLSGERITRDLPSQATGIPYPIQPPVFPNNDSKVDVPSFQFAGSGLTGKHLSFILMWNNDANLEEYEVKSMDITGDTTLKTRNEVVTS